MSTVNKRSITAAISPAESHDTAHPYGSYIMYIRPPLPPPVSFCRSARMCRERVLLKSCSRSLRRNQKTSRRLSGLHIVNSTVNFRISAAAYLPFPTRSLNMSSRRSAVDWSDQWYSLMASLSSLPALKPSSTKRYFATTVADCDTDSAALHFGRCPKAILNESVTISMSRVS